MLSLLFRQGDLGDFPDQGPCVAFLEVWGAEQVENVRCPDSAADLAYCTKAWPKNTGTSVGIQLEWPGSDATYKPTDEIRPALTNASRKRKPSLQVERRTLLHSLLWQFLSGLLLLQEFSFFNHFSERATESFGYRSRDFQTRIPLVSFDQSDVIVVKIRFLGQEFLRQSPFRSSPSHHESKGLGNGFCHSSHVVLHSTEEPHTVVLTFGFE